MGKGRLADDHEEIPFLPREILEETRYQMMFELTAKKRWYRLRCWPPTWHTRFLPATAFNSVAIVISSALLEDSRVATSAGNRRIQYDSDVEELGSTPQPWSAGPEEHEVRKAETGFGSPNSAAD